MEDNKNIEGLFHRYLDNECTPGEIKILLQHFDVVENEDLLKNLIRRQSEINNDVPASYYQALKPLLDIAFSKIEQTIAADKAKQTPVVPLYKKMWFRVGAAAVLIFLVSTTVFYFLYQKKEPMVVAQKENYTEQLKDIPPGSNNAILTLANGTTIVLDTAANGVLAQQGHIKVLKINGQITYNKTGSVNGIPVYNTITTATGNQYQLILADGSKVWLNAASSIRFPAYFTGNERKVEITGEAYFEVAKNAEKPFKVEFNNQSGGKGEIEVLGTHFNVNAYPDEEDVKTTLLEGSVKIKKANQVQMLSPGQQARITSNSIALKTDIDVSQVVAWKNGFFLFNNTDIQMIMRQVARWYDVDAHFEGKIPREGFTGKISRNVPLSKFLKILKLNDVNVKTEGRVVTVIF